MFLAGRACDRCLRVTPEKLRAGPSSRTSHQARDTSAPCHRRAAITQRSGGDRAARPPASNAWFDVAAGASRRSHGSSQVVGDGHRILVVDEDLIVDRQR
jgi:hypothetical protein